MKSFLSFLAVAILLSVGASTTSAQNGAFAPYVDAGISVSSTTSGTNTFTASNPNYVLGAGIESSTKHLLLDLDGQFSTQNVRTFGFGSGSAYTGTVTGSGYLNLGGFLLGGGARYRDLVTGGNFATMNPFANKDSLVPFVGGGYQFSRDRILVDYVLPGRSADPGQREVDFHNEIFLTKGAHFRLTQDVVAASSTPFGPGFRVTGISAGVGLKVVF